MKRKDFYIEYYNRTNRVFSDKIIDWRKGHISKLERKIVIVLQYLTLLLCWLPAYFNHRIWFVIPIAISCSLLLSLITDFSIHKIEILYFIYRKNSVYCSLLHDIFLGRYTEFLNELTRFTKKEVMGYVFTNGGKFYGKFRAVCRNKSKKIVLKFKISSVIVIVNEKRFVIKGALPTKEHLITEIAAIIHSNEQN